MTWLLWRQHRQQALVTGVALALFGVAVWLTGVHMADEYHRAVTTCGTDPACTLVDNLFRGDGAIIDLVHLTVAVPILLGVFLGVTLVARETEQATNVLAWTQTVTRRRWLVSKVVLALVATVVLSAAISALVTWWSGTPNALYGNRFEGAEFDTQNIVPVADALFAVALGIASGALLRRVLPALAATVFGFAGIRLVVSVFLRPHYLSVITMSLGGAGTDVPSGSWTVSRGLVDGAGRSAAGPIQIPTTCQGADRGDLKTCLSQAGFHDVVKLHPASQYWPFQWIESGLFVGLAALLIAFALLHTIRHDA